MQQASFSFLPTLPPLDTLTKCRYCEATLNAADKLLTGVWHQNYLNTKSLPCRSSLGLYLRKQSPGLLWQSALSANQRALMYLSAISFPAILRLPRRGVRGAGVADSLLPTINKATSAYCRTPSLGKLDFDPTPEQI